MSKKITISVPDFLHEKIEQWRGSFNLSRLFQDAVSDAIQKKEELGKRLKSDINLQEVIERLKREKLESEHNFFKEGEKSGIEWASRAHYRDLKNVLRQPAEKIAKQSENLQSYFKSLYIGKKLEDLENDASGKYHMLFLEGWKNGVKEFWDAIKEKLGEN